MTYRAPKGITNHPGVQECTSGEDGGSDYRHDIMLKKGWQFASGKTAGCRTLLCNTVQDFTYARPVCIHAAFTTDGLRSRVVAAHDALGGYATTQQIADQVLAMSGAETQATRAECDFVYNILEGMAESDMPSVVEHFFEGLTRWSSCSLVTSPATRPVDDQQVDS